MGFFSVWIDTLVHWYVMCLISFHTLSEWSSQLAIDRLPISEWLRGIIFKTASWRILTLTSASVSRTVGTRANIFTSFLSSQMTSVSVLLFELTLYTPVMNITDLLVLKPDVLFCLVLCFCLVLLYCNFIWLNLIFYSAKKKSFTL